MPAPVSEATKRLRGTLHKRPVPPSVGTPRISRPIAAPKDFSPALREHWKRHMVMMVASGRMAAVDLLAFAELVKAAHLAEVSYLMAIDEGPTTEAENGTKVGAAWRAHMLAAANYRTWLTRFGLEPKGRAVVKQLPGLPGDLRLVDDDD